MSDPTTSTAPVAEKPALSEAQRAERLRALARRVHAKDGFDRDALRQIEQLTGEQR